MTSKILRERRLALDLSFLNSMRPNPPQTRFSEPYWLVGQTGVYTLKCPYASEPPALHTNTLTHKQGFYRLCLWLSHIQANRYKYGLWPPQPWATAN